MPRSEMPSERRRRQHRAVVAELTARLGVQKGRRPTSGPTKRRARSPRRRRKTARRKTARRKTARRKTQRRPRGERVRMIRLQGELVGELKAAVRLAGPLEPSQAESPKLVPLDPHGSRATFMSARLDRESPRSPDLITGRNQEVFTP